VEIYETAVWILQGNRIKNRGVVKERESDREKRAKGAAKRKQPPLFFAPKYSIV
jgi:hypothetical protein